jgi:hypothetical protein
MRPPPAEIRIQHLRDRPRADLRKGRQRQAGLIRRVLAGVRIRLGQVVRGMML